MRKSITSGVTIYIKRPVKKLFPGFCINTLATHAKKFLQTRSNNIAKRANTTHLYKTIPVTSSVSILVPFDDNSSELFIVVYFTFPSTESASSASLLEGALYCITHPTLAPEVTVIFSKEVSRCPLILPKRLRVATHSLALPAIFPCISRFHAATSKSPPIVTPEATVTFPAATIRSHATD